MCTTSNRFLLRTVPRNLYLWPPVMCFLNGWRRQLDGTVETETVAANASTSAAAAAVVVIVDEDRALFASSMRRREIPPTFLLSKNVSFGFCTSDDDPI